MPLKGAGQGISQGPRGAEAPAKDLPHHPTPACIFTGFVILLLLQLRTSSSSPPICKVFIEPVTLLLLLFMFWVFLAVGHVGSKLTD